MADDPEKNIPMSEKTAEKCVLIPHETRACEEAAKTTGDPTQQVDSQSELPEDNFESMAFSLVHTFRVQSEEKDPWIRHIEVLPDGNILLSDRYNCQLLLYDSNGILLKKAKLPSGPWNMTMTNNNLVAITLPDSKSVVFYTPNTLKSSTKFQVHDDCRGIACVGNRLFVNCVTNGLKIMTMAGKTLKVLPQYVGYMSLARGPKDRLLATLFAEDRMVCIDLKGKVRYDFTQKSLCGPTSFAVDNGKEHLYIVGHHGNTINLLSKKGKESRVLLNKKNGIDRPWAIGYDSCVKKLFISNFGGKNISVLQQSTSKAIPGRSETNGTQP